MSISRDDYTKLPLKKPFSSVLICTPEPGPRGRAGARQHARPEEDEPGRVGGEQRGAAARRGDDDGRGKLEAPLVVAARSHCQACQRGGQEIEAGKT